MAGPGAEIGTLLVQVQEDLQQLKEKLRAISQGWGAADVGSLEAAIERTESGLRKHAEKYLTIVNTSVLTISASESTGLCSRQISKWGIPVEASQKDIVFPEMSAVSVPRGISSPPASPRSKHKLSMMLKILYDPQNAQHRKVLHQNYGVGVPLVSRRKMAPVSPRKVTKGVTVGSLSVAPPSFHLNSSCSVLPLTKMDAQKGILSLIERGLIPRAARITLEEPLVLPKPAPLHEFHTKHKKRTAGGSAEGKKAETRLGPPRSRTSKGSKGTKGSIAPPPSCISVVSLRKPKLIPAIQTRESAINRVCRAKVGGAYGAALCRSAPAFRKPSPPFITCRIALFVPPIQSPERTPRRELGLPPTEYGAPSADGGAPWVFQLSYRDLVMLAFLGHKSANIDHPESTSAKLLETPEVTTAQAFQNLAVEFDVLVRKGNLDQEAADLVAFKQHCCLFWGSALSFLEHVAKLLKDYAVPLAVIKGKKVMELLLDFEFRQRPTREELLSVIKNHVAVRKLLNRPGQRYKGQKGTEAAATKIQATWRCYRRRKAYINFRRRQWASGVVAISWLVRMNMCRIRKTLWESRQKHLENFYDRAKHLAANWNRIRTSKRTVIHIPSLGYAQYIREATPDFAIHQGSQIGRLCEIQDPNVDVIYVCPLQLSEELLQYYHKLLGLQAAVRSGDPKDIADLQDRFKILTPEAINSFPSRPMALATFLKYSPKTLQRIRNLIRGKEAYIVGGLLRQDDLEVADALDLPILGPDPEVALLYSSKSGSKRVFASAGVPMPPGQHDIYNRQQMVEVLSQLIIDYPEVKRWIFKVDNDFGGNGTAYCDVTAHLKCYPWVQKEHRRYSSEVWQKKWAHEPALAKISQELPGLLAQHAQAVNEKRFPTWGKFLQTFVSQGGVIEAFPPSDSVTNLTVDMLIEPTGEITMVSLGDQIHADGPLRSSGTTFPQASVEPGVLNSLCSKIGEACKARGVVGYFSIDFATFIHPQTMGQQVWAVDLDLHYSDHLALTQVLLYVTNGKLDGWSSRFEVQLVPRKLKFWQVPKEQPQTASVVSRSVVMSSSVMHTSLSFIYYSVFLQMCKAHGIGYDVQQKEGTVFMIFEDQKRHRFGMLTIGEHLQGALMTFAHHLFIIYQELSAPNLHAETNFKGAVRDVETILGVAEHNKLQFEEEEQQASKARGLTK
ncbi:PREDICTED: IQ domain-containing protein H [Gekko japonicus]|uniref:IQ domain-containing protein H n=1 Tax=Gekko japonicus TaxID=146911 RepID=A0ABM1K8P5_GEKJA|nr:PREDICTED: IQ domain-containing protein H [Gekko japonicus]